ncbi:MAG: hypothetical protein V1649_01335 [Patescibacteria group bacterium]
MTNFQQTVNLKEEMEQRKKQKDARQRVSSSNQIEHIYNQLSEDNDRKELQKINRPAYSKAKLNPSLTKLVVFVLVFLIIGWTVYCLFLKNHTIFNKTAKSQIWYAVKLVNNETFYGQIEDVKTDPIVMANVYYNYDQDKDKDNQKKITETTNLRLVKRGKETHGPVGTMDLVRSQVLFMEPLKDDSKVLHAILEYENNYYSVN